MSGKVFVRRRLGIKVGSQMLSRTAFGAGIALAVDLLHRALSESTGSTLEVVPAAAYVVGAAFGPAGILGFAGTQFTQRLLEVADVIAAWLVAHPATSTAALLTESLPPIEQYRVVWLPAVHALAALLAYLAMVASTRFDRSLSTPESLRALYATAVLSGLLEASMAAMSPAVELGSLGWITVTLSTLISIVVLAPPVLIFLSRFRAVLVPLDGERAPWRALHELVVDPVVAERLTTPRDRLPALFSLTLLMIAAMTLAIVHLEDRLDLGWPLLYLLAVLLAAELCGLRGSVLAASVCGVAYLYGKSWYLEHLDAAIPDHASLFAMENYWVFLISALGPLAGIRREREIALRLELRATVHIDPLTGLFGRQRIEEEIARELLRASRTGKSVAVAVLNLDHFKSLNDASGHAVGDAVLRAVADILRRGCRASDLAGRWGGEEMVILLPGASAEIAKRRIEELLAAVRAEAWPLACREHPEALAEGQPVTFSAGVAAAPDHGDDGAALVRAAAAALYSAKDSGRNQVRIAEATTARLPFGRIRAQIVVA